MHTLGADKAVGGNVDEGFKGGRGCLILAVLFADRPTLFCQPRTWLFCGKMTTAQLPTAQLPVFPKLHLDDTLGVAFIGA